MIEEGLVQRLGGLLMRGLLRPRRHSQRGRSFFSEGCHLRTRGHLAMSGGCTLLALTGGTQVMGSSPLALTTVSWVGPLQACVEGHHEEGVFAASNQWSWNKQSFNDRWSSIILSRTDFQLIAECDDARTKRGMPFRATKKDRLFKGCCERERAWECVSR